MANLNDPKTFFLALISGIIPSFIWLWFWLREDKEEPEPKGVVTTIFITGMMSVLFVLPIQKLIQNNIDSQSMQTILWASAEEIIKYLAVILVLYKSNYINKPIDWAIYLMTVALGFAALENMMFLMRPFSLGQTIVGLLTGQLRFLGSTLLHSVSSGIIGVALGLSFYKGEMRKKWYLTFGIIIAITLNSLFNFFIIKNNGNDFYKIFAFLWVVTIIIMLLFEKLRRMSGE